MIQSFCGKKRDRLIFAQDIQSLKTLLSNLVFAFQLSTQMCQIYCRVTVKNNFALLEKNGIFNANPNHYYSIAFKTYKNQLFLAK